MKAGGMLLVALVAALALVGRAAAPPAARCAGAKGKAAARYGDAVLTCHATAVPGGGTVDPVCLEKAAAKLAAKFAAVEAKGGCVGVDDASAVEMAVGQVGDAVVAAITGTPPGALLGTEAARRCGAAKLRAVGKKLKAKLTCHAKAVQRGTVADAACLGRAEARYEVRWTAAEAVGGCATTGDAVAVEALVDGGVAAVQALLPGATTTTTQPAGSTTSTTAPLPTTTTTSLPPDPATVAPPLDASVATDVGTATAFLYSGPTPIQTGVIAGTIELRRAAVVRGQVLARNGDPLPGVRVRVLDHPELGETRSRADGWFDLAVNGGGTLTVVYEGADVFPAQRAVAIGWQEFVVAPAVRLVARDPQVTAVDLAGAGEMQVARGSVETDTDGTRRATLLFAPDTHATLTLPGGGTQSVATLHVRATEYTVGSGGPEAMPADLPATSAYTYAVELSADEAEAAGATQVTFDQPVAVLVENFLGFPVGTGVPVGAYDRQRGVWVPVRDGVVLGVVGVTNGLADVDTDGDGMGEVPATLATFGITAEERARLAALYAVGQTLWRFQVTHFSPYDCNWFYDDGSVETDGGPPDNPPPEEEDDEPDDPDCLEGSVLGCQTQSWGDAVPVVGTPFHLVYRSERVPGRVTNRTLRIPVSGATLPAGVQGISVTVTVAGQRRTTSLPVATQQTHFFTWDGLDAYGRRLQGRQAAVVRVSYHYIGRYRRPVSQPPTWGAWTATPTFVTLRRPAVRSQEFRTTIGGWDARGVGLGGWTLSVHHAYDPGGRVLYLGSGSKRTAAALGQAIQTVAGGGTADPGDGGPATDAQLQGAAGVAVTPDGTRYVTGDPRGLRVVTPDGTITTWAAPELASAGAIAAAPDGSVYVASDRVYRVTGAGGITPVAGNGVLFGSAYQGDDGPALAAELPSFNALAVGPDGSVYIGVGYEGADTGVVRVGTDGRATSLTQVVGNQSSSGDDGPVGAAGVFQPVGLAFSPEGDLYIAEGNTFATVRRVDRDGIIRHIAGRSGGYLRIDGDGGPALAANLGFLTGLAFGPDGGYVLVATDGTAVRLRRVGSDGIILPSAGYGPPGFSGDGGNAVAAGLGWVVGVAMGPDGSTYVTDNGVRVRQIAPPLRGLAAGDVLVASASGRLVYVLSATGRHLATRAARTGALRYQFTYDGAGRLVAIMDRDGAVTTIARTPAGAPQAIVAPGGQRTTLTVTPDGYLETITNPNGESVTVDYYAGGLVHTVTNARAQTTTVAYDARGRLAEEADAASGRRTVTRTETDGARDYTVQVTGNAVALGTYREERLADGSRRRTVTAPSGLATVRPTGADGVQTRTTPDGTVTTRTPAPDPRFGLVAATAAVTTRLPSGLARISVEARSVMLTDPHDPLALAMETTTRVVNGRVTTETYDAATRTLTATSPAGRTAVTTYDAAGRVVAVTPPGLAPTTYAYNPVGLLATVTAGTGPDARVTAFTYDAARRLASVTDALGQTTMFPAYDGADRLLALTRPDGAPVGLAYDATGNVTGVTPPGQPAHTFGYTPVDLEDRYTPPALGPGDWHTQYAYDLDRRLARVTRPDGLALVPGYDSAGRPVRLTTPEGTTTLTYDPTTGQVATGTTPDGVGLAYRYDGALRTGTTWSGLVAGTVTHTVDADFRVATEHVNTGTPVAFGYDADGLRTQAGALTLTRDPGTGLVSGTTLGVVTTTAGYNAFGEPVSRTASVQSVPVLTVTFTRDGLGRLATQTETLGGMTTMGAYGYDTAGRLETVTRDGVLAVTYQYDANGNRLAKSTAGGTVTGTYDAQDRLVAYGEATYTYTANGELETTTVGTAVTQYRYDVLGNLRAVTLPSGTLIEYVIDGENRRIGKRVNGTLTQGFLYGDRLRIVAELDGAGAVVSRFVYGEQVNVPEYLERGGQMYRLLTDHLGSPRLVVDVNSGTIAQRIDYDEFGRVLDDTNPGFQPFGFAGGLYDRDTELVRFGARDYDATTGRWTAKDPIGFAAGDSNLYGYGLGDPINRMDPLGLAVGDWWDPATYVDYAAGFGGGTVDFYEQYRAMREARTKDADKFFHCMANCLAWRRGRGGQDAAKILSEGRELFDEYVKGDPRSVCDEDRAANRQGRDPVFPPDAGCAERCSSLAPPWFRP